MPQPVTLEMAADAVAAFVTNNPLPRGELPALVKQFMTLCRTLRRRGEFDPEREEPKEPAVSIRNSVTPEYLICLEDGKHFKSLKRRLATHGLTPGTVSRKMEASTPTIPWLPPTTAAVRSAMAKAIGLEQVRGSAGARKHGRMKIRSNLICASPPIRDQDRTRQRRCDNVSAPFSSALAFAGKIRLHSICAGLTHSVTFAAYVCAS